MLVEDGLRSRLAAAARATALQFAPSIIADRCARAGGCALGFPGKGLLQPH